MSITITTFQAAERVTQPESLNSLVAMGYLFPFPAPLSFHGYEVGGKGWKPEKTNSEVQLARSFEFQFEFEKKDRVIMWSLVELNDPETWTGIGKWKEDEDKSLEEGKGQKRDKVQTGG